MKTHNGMAVINGAVCHEASKDTPGAFLHYGTYYIGERALLAVLRGIYERIIADFGRGCALYEHKIMEYVNGDSFTFHQLRRRYNMEACGVTEAGKLYAI